MPRLLYLSQDQAHFPLSLPEGFEADRESVEGVPTADYLRGFDYLLLLGSLNDRGWATQFTGVLRRVIPEGLVVIVAHHPTPDDVVSYFLQRLDIGNMSPLNALWEVRAVHPAFQEYFDLFGQSQTWLDGDDHEILGRTDLEGDDLPTSIHVPRGRGGVYTVPFYFSGAQGQFAELLLSAVDAHRA